MEKVLVEHSPDKARLDEMGVFNWPVWEKEVSRFDWFYDSAETCYLLEGRVVVEPEGNEAVEFGAGDLVVFPKGLKCVWDIKEAVRKHYNFS